MGQNDINPYPIRINQRLLNHNYSKKGFYFITITLKNKIPIFGKICNSNIKLNKYGIIVDECWNKIPEHFPECKLDEYIIMPDHFHAIIQIVRNRHACSVRRQHQLIPLAIGGFKSAVSKLIHQEGYYDFKWHKSYNDRILRRYELRSKRDYIRNNPKKYTSTIQVG